VVSASLRGFEEDHLVCIPGIHNRILITHWQDWVSADCSCGDSATGCRRFVEQIGSIRITTRTPAGGSS
jgi:hypothetical protein